MIRKTFSKAIVRILLWCLVMQGHAYGEEVKLIRTVNDLPITNFDLREQEKVTKFVIDFLKIDSAKEKLTCDLKNTDLPQFVLLGLSEDVILDGYLSKVAEKLPNCSVTKDEVISVINNIAQHHKISSKNFETALKKYKIDPDQLIEFFGREIERGKIIRRVFEDECLNIQEDEVFRIALTNGCLTDVKLEYIYLSEPYNKQGLKSLMKNRIKLQKEINTNNKGIKKAFLTEIADQEIAENLLNIDQNSASKIWKSGNSWKMVYLCKRTMINPDLRPLNSHFQSIASMKMQGNVQKLFSQVEGSSFTKDLEK